MLTSQPRLLLSHSGGRFRVEGKGCQTPPFQTGCLQQVAQISKVWESLVTPPRRSIWYLFQTKHLLQMMGAGTEVQEAGKSIFPPHPFSIMPSSLIQVEEKLTSWGGGKGGAEFRGRRPPASLWLETLPLENHPLCLELGDCSG